MEVRAIARGVRVQPRKVRIVADEIRGKSATHAATLLRYHSTKGARELRKVLMSAIANAQENNNLSPETLRISTIMVDEGPRLKRIQAKAMGRAGRIIKKSSHITVVVEEYEPMAAVKPHGTKAKPRPKFEAPKPKKGKKEEPVAAAPVEETTDTAAEEATTAEVVETAAPEQETAIAEATEPQEATPVTEAEAPEEQGSAEPVSEQEETTEEAEGADGEAEKKGVE
jgi:large subunit ribosomal protein L22